MARFDRGGFKGGGDRRPKQLFDATCANCGKATQVPFRPTGDRPVYCRECFAQMGGGEERGREAGARGFKPTQSSPITNSPDHSALKRELQEVNAKLERLITAVQSLAQVTTSAEPIKSLKKPVKKVSKK
ncbi:MAG: CxxC-x17-CxxC domain-containing protein [Patescibacteria group bacterium]